MRTTPLIHSLSSYFKGQCPSNCIAKALRNPRTLRLRNLSLRLNPVVYCIVLYSLLASEHKCVTSSKNPNSECDQQKKMFIMPFAAAEVGQNKNKKLNFWFDWIIRQIPKIETNYKNVKNYRNINCTTDRYCLLWLITVNKYLCIKNQCSLRVKFKNKVHFYC